MKRQLFSVMLLCLIGSAAVAQQNKKWGIGGRVGAPIGLTAKKYFSTRHTVELSIGRAWMFDESRTFHRYGGYERERFEYEWYTNRSSFSVQARYLSHQRLPRWRRPTKLMRGIEWYYGGGVQLRRLAIDYGYRRYETSERQSWTTHQDRIGYIELGIDGIIGLEYAWRDVPITVFADINVFLKMLNDPLLPYLQGGIGGRYYF